MEREARIMRKFMRKRKNSMRDSDKSLKTKFTDYEVYTFGYPGQKKKNL